MLIVTVQLSANCSATFQFHEDDFAQTFLKDFVGYSGHLHLTLAFSETRSGKGVLQIKASAMVT